MSKIICIDPGHGGADPGAVNGSRYEANDNLRLALAVRTRLVEQGHTVVMTHTGLGVKEKLGLDARSKKSADSKADLFASLHRNSHSDKTAKGIEIWIRNSTHAQAAAEALEELAKVEHQANRGVKIGAYRVLYNCTDNKPLPMPSMLIELGFISNTQDNELYDLYFEDNATAIARGILAALGEDWKEPGKPKETPKSLARIQLGAFTWPENEAGARRVMEEARKAGFQCFLVIPDTNLAEVE